MAKRVAKADTSQCANCGATLVFDPVSQELLCERCGSTFKFAKSYIIAEHLWTERKIAKPTGWAKQAKMLNCENCGAQVVMNSLEFSKECPYCGSNHVLEDSGMPEMTPDGIIPFAFNAEEANKRFRENVKNRFFVPSAFKKSLPRNKVHGIYIPAFVFDAKTESDYDGMLEISEQVMTDKGFQTFPRHYSINGHKSLTHTDFVVEASSKINDYQLTSLLPYKMDEGYAFNTNFVRGYSVEHYSEMLQDCHALARRQMDNAIRQDILKNHSYTDVEYLNIKTTYKDEKYSYRLLPVYNFEYEYKNKKYLTIMNGQTGQIGSGLPTSGVKIAFVTILSALFILGIFLLVFLA